MSAQPQSLLESELDAMYKEVRAEAAALARSSSWRRRGAYTLKLVAAGGGLFVATGLAPGLHQGIGIAVLVAVFVDSVYSNHDRLIADTEGAYAYEVLGNSVRRQYARDANDAIVRLRGGDVTAQKEIDALMKRAHEQLADGLQKIKDEIHKKNVQALRNLSLEAERASAQKA